MCLVQQPSPTPSGGLEIPLVLQFQSRKYVTHCKMKKFMQTLYDYRYTGTKTDSSDEELKNPRRKSVFQLKKET